jgi:hypothetical protein
VAWARANAGAVPQGVAVEQVPTLATTGNPAYTVDVSHWVMHLEADVPPNSLTEWWLGGALGAGYHLVKVLPLTSCLTPTEMEACVVTLIGRGVPDDGTSNPGTARAYCLAPYRLQPATVDDPIVLQLGGVPQIEAPICP